MKKTLILSLILAPLFSFAALTPCAPGDKFDLYTGKACATTPVNASDTETYIASLIAEINSLKAQLADINKDRIVGSVPSTPTLSLGCQTLKDDYVSKKQDWEDAVGLSQQIYQNLAGKDSEIAYNKVYRGTIENNLLGAMNAAKQKFNVACSN